MHCLLIGYGSIGKRHHANVLALGHTCDVFDIHNESQLAAHLANVPYDYALICTPNDSHLDYCLRVANAGVPFMCEKPLFTPDVYGLDHSMRVASVLSDICEERNLINMVGCNLRFTDAIKKLPSDTKYVNVYCGYNLKRWRPQADHLESYSANKSMGGGVLFDAIHEFDYLYSVFGEIGYMKTHRMRLTSMTNDTEDVVHGVIHFKNGTFVTIHVNYLSNIYTRWYEYVPTNEDTLIHVKIDVGDQMYIDELKYFVECVASKTQTMNTIDNAMYLIEKMYHSISIPHAHTT